MFEVEYESPGQKTGELIISSPFSLILDGRNIDSYYSNSGIRIETTNISGRQTTEYDIQTTTPAKYDGQMVLGKRMKAKSIQVVLLVESNEFGLVQAFMSELNTLLRNTKNITFKDEIDLAYYVEFESADVPQEGSRQEVSLNFLWHDPVKYRVEKQIDYINAQHLMIDSIEPVHPVIELVFETGIKTWSMRNTSTGMFERMMAKSGFVTTLNTVTIDTDQITIRRYDGGVLISQGMQRFGSPIITKPFPASEVTFDGTNYVTQARATQTFERAYGEHSGRWMNIGFALSLRWNSSNASSFVLVTVRPQNLPAGVSFPEQSEQFIAYRDSGTRSYAMRIPLPVPTFGAMSYTLEFSRVGDNVSDFVQIRTERCWVSS